MKTLENHVYSEIERLRAQRKYPYAAALQEFHHHEYHMKIYDETPISNLKQDLVTAIEKFRNTGSSHFSYWAVFDNLKNLNEDDFESKMREEFSPIRRFQVNLEGTSFFVVVLHPRNSRRSRRFPWPALVFNTVEGMNELDEIFDGYLNPLVLLYSHRWEALQKRSG